MKKALRKGSATSEEDSIVRQGRDDDDTDTEHHDSLPHDEEGKEKRSGLSKLQQIRRIRKPSLVDIVQIAKSEREKERALQQQFNNGNKETHPKARFKIEKSEKKEDKEDNNKEKDKENEKKPEKGSDKDSPDTDNDPEINTRVINERRESLLRKNHENKERDKQKENDKDKDSEKEKEKDKDKEKQKDKQNSPSDYKRRIYESLKRKKREDKDKSNLEKKESQEKPKEDNIQESPTKADASTLEKPKNSDKRRSFRRWDRSPIPKEKPKDEENNGKSSFKVVDEKNSSSSPDEKTPPPAMEHFHNLSGKFKFKRHKNKICTEPEVFKFESDKIKANKSSDGATTPTWEQSESEQYSPKLGEEATTPTSAHHINMGADKLASLSRHGRKKIGSLLALVKEAVNTKKLEQEQQGDESPTQPSEIAIDIPVTPESELPTPQLNETFILPSDIPVSTITSIQPYIMPRAPLEAPEDLELPSYYSNMTTEATNTLPLKDPEELDQPGPIIFPPRSISQRRRPTDRPVATRQDSTASTWSDIIPTITISTTPDGEDQTSTRNDSVPSSPGPLVNVIKINIENDK